MNVLKQWVEEQYTVEELQDIINHGCVSGCAHGLVYYNETTEFYNDYHEEIWDMLYQDADSQGITIIEMLAQFNGQKNVGSDAQFKNMLVWYAVEECARQLLDTEE